jgi:protein-tyrosine-phosphatase
MLQVIALLAVSLAVAGAPQASSTATSAHPTRVLFLCPHGAAKSVLASTYFRRRAEERGLRVRVDAAGTEPDPAISPKVADLLRSKGYAPPTGAPRRVTADDVAAADLVISLGCDLKAYPVKPGTLRQWDVPGPGENLAASDAAIREKVDALIDELLRAAAAR